jgi:hypothetical protein
VSWICSSRFSQLRFSQLRDILGEKTYEKRIFHIQNCSNEIKLITVAAHRGDQ